MSVVFPAPFGPRSPNSSPRGTLSVTSLNATRVFVFVLVVLSRLVNPPQTLRLNRQCAHIFLHVSEKQKGHHRFRR